MKVFISQSNYIPWKGYFDAIHRVETMAIYDCVQYTKNDWRNRNLIKTPQGLQWLSIPVRVHSLSQLIKDTEVASDRWAEKHWKTIEQNYRSAPFFEQFNQGLKFLYLEAKNEKNLSNINFLFISHFLSLLEVDTNLFHIPEVDLSENATQRLVNICKDLNATTYLTGPSARNYLEVDKFTDAGIEVEWMDYSNYPEYEQLYPGYEDRVSILDVLFNCGPDARKYALRG